MGRASDRIDTLDGWRAVAILAVVAHHAALYGRFHDRFWAAQGGTGVDLFFVISGFIITWRLLGEEDQNGTFSLKSFYERRARRILPLVVTYLLAVGFLGLASLRELGGSLFFVRNYQMVSNPAGTYTAQLWSLAIEEHFYLIWPALLLMLKERRALWVSLSVAAASALWRAHDYGGSWVSALFPQTSSYPYFHAIRTDTRLDGLMLGCAAAIALRDPRVRGFVFRNFPKETPLLVGFVLLPVLLAGKGLPSLAACLLMMVAIVSTIVVEEGLAYKWLNWPPLTWIGRISFSLYIWQQLFLTHERNASAGFLQRFPVNIGCSFVVAYMSYVFVERAFAKRTPPVPSQSCARSGPPDSVAEREIEAAVGSDFVSAGSVLLPDMGPRSR